MSKRKADVQITRERDVDTDDDSRFEPIEATMRASEEMMMKRAIAKPRSRLSRDVEAHFGASTTALENPAAPSATFAKNPFAAFKATAPAAAVAAPNTNADAASAKERTIDAQLKQRALNTVFARTIARFAQNEPYTDWSSVCKQYVSYREAMDEKMERNAAPANTTAASFPQSRSSTTAINFGDTAVQKEPTPAASDSGKFSLTASNSENARPAAETDQKPFTFGKYSSQANDNDTSMDKPAGSEVAKNPHAAESVQKPLNFSFGLPSMQTGAGATGSNAVTTEKADEMWKTDIAPFKKEESNAEPTFSFGSAAEKPAFSFGSAATQPAFTFGKTAVEIAAPIDQDAAGAKPAFSFGSSDKPAFTFGQTDKPTFSFGANPKFEFGKPLGGNNAFAFNSNTSGKPDLGLAHATGARADSAGDEQNEGEDGDDGTEGDDAAAQPDFAGKGPGEENEDAVYEKRAKVYELEKGEFKTLGVGELRVLVHRETKKGRLLVRADGSGRVLLNVALHKEIPYTVEGKGQVKVINVKPDGSAVTYMLRVKTAEDGEQLKDTLERVKI